jgi:hypothetical integral membrane protein (TIGR02206 family)
MTSAEFPTFGFEHNLYLLASFVLWFGLPWSGKRYMTKHAQMTVAIILIVVTLLQELSFDIFQLYIDDFDIGDDLSLHMCGLSLFISSYALYYKSQAAFEISFFWGIVGAAQAIFTPDPSRFPYGDISIFFNFFSHGIIILNVFWLMIVDGMRCRKDALLNTFLVSNGAVFVIGFINKIIGHDANYWFVCRKPGGDSPFLIGEWPYYLYTFVSAAFVLMFIIYIPMWISANRAEKKLIKHNSALN